MVCRRVGASFGPEGLQAGAVKWLNTQLGVGGGRGLSCAGQHNTSALGTVGAKRPRKQNGE